MMAWHARSPAVGLNHESCLEVASPTIFVATLLETATIRADA